jgi:hypothetical protein
MRDHISQACRLPPWEFWVFFSETLWHLARRFANDLEAVNDGKKCTAVALQIRRRFHTLRAVENIITSLENILEIQLGITRRHKAGLFRWMVL